MKKIFLNLLLAITLCSSLSSCATVFGGRVTEAQRTRPAMGEPTRPLRAVALIADIVLFWPGLIVDFATGAIYKPERKAATPATKSSTVELKTTEI
jgi:hypothetical protein